LCGAALVLLAGCAAQSTAPAPGAATRAPAQPVPAETPAAPAPADAGVPRAAQVHYRAALELMQRELFDEAAQSFEAMTRTYPDLSGPYLNLGIIHTRQGRTAEAEGVLRVAAERDPRNPLAWNLLGLAYREAGRFADARAAYEQALAIDSGYGDARFNLAVLYDLYLQQPEQALINYELYRRAGGEGDAMLERWIAELRQQVSNRRGAAGGGS
jgi:Flp pilus assembly protein TadD